MRGPRGVLVLAIAFVLLAVLPAVSGSNNGPSPTQSILSVGAMDQMKTRNVLAPIALDDPYTMAVLGRVYDTPVQRDPTTWAVVPRLAVGVDANGNGVLDPAEVGAFSLPAASASITVFYNFTNARFHDGVPVTAMDLLFSYHVLALHPRVWGPLWVLMDRGGGPGSNASTDRWLGVTAVDDGDGNPATEALRFSLQFAYPLFTSATLGIPVLPRHIWEGTGGGRHTDLGLAVYPEGDPRQGQGIPVTETAYTPFNLVAAESWNPTDADVIGSGHFRFGTWSFGSFARVDANPDYAFGRPKIDSILFKIYRTTQLAVLALQSGEIAFLLNTVPVEFIPDLRNDPNIGLVMAPALHPASLVFNMRRQPFGYLTFPPADARTDDIGLPLRLAFASLVDKATMVHTLLQDYGVIADGFVSPLNTAWYNGTLPARAYDPTQAGLILDNAGWTKTGAGNCQSDGTNCRSFPRLGTSQFEILTPQADFDPIRASAGAMIASAARSIGVNVISRPSAFGYILSALDAHDFDLAIVKEPDVHANDPWTLSREDPDYLFDLFHAANGAAGRNRFGFWDPEFDARIGASRAEADPSVRAIEVRAAQGILADRSPGVPMYYQHLTWAYRTDRFQGWILTASTLFNYWSLQGLEAPQNPGPQIRLNSPANGATIARGGLIDLDVWDTDLSGVSYTLDGTYSTSLSSPYDINAYWSDGRHTLTVWAMDSTGNATRAAYDFTVDGTPPSVLLVSPPNGSLLPGGTVIDFAVSDAHLGAVSLSVDGGTPAPLAAPYDVATTGLTDGPHVLAVYAVDTVGNSVAKSYAFTLDATRPAVTIRTPEGEVPSPLGEVRVTFSEAVNTTSAEASFSITDGIRTWRAGDGTFYWTLNRTSFTFVPNSPFTEGVEYRVTLNGTLKDEAGNTLASEVMWTFALKAPGSGSPPVLVLATAAALLIAAIVGLLLVVVMRRKRRAGGPNAKSKP